MYKGAKFVTAVQSWDDRFEGMWCHGHIVCLYADGTVWEIMGKMNQEGAVAYLDGKKTMVLAELAKAFKKDLDGLGATFRAMYRHKDYEICSPLVLETLAKLD